MRGFTAEQIMERMGFPATEMGPFVTELRTLVGKQVADGMTNRSGGTWAPGTENITCEERARLWLSFEWHLQRQHHFEVKVLDPIIQRRYKFDPDKSPSDFDSYIEINWKKIPAWLGDRWRELGMNYRVWRDRNLKNPYEP